MSKLLLSVCECLGVEKMNTSAYHPQTYGLVERFNHTLLDMLAKSVSPGVSEWDERLPYVLFTYRASMQLSTGESLFFLLYGRDPRLPTATVLSPPLDRRVLELDDYKSTLVRELSSAWTRAQEAVAKAQKQQKQQYDKTATDCEFSVGDRVFVCMPARKTGHLRKLACPFEGPYRVLALYPNGMDVRPVEKPGAQSFCVALNRVRCCPQEVPELKEAATPVDGRRAVGRRNNSGSRSGGPPVMFEPLSGHAVDKSASKEGSDSPRDPPMNTNRPAKSPPPGIWAGRLRPRSERGNVEIPLN